MDIPITLRFFEKLNLFLEVKRIDRENRTLWKTEKRILSWAANPLHHAHLHTPLTIQMALDHEEITGLERSDNNNCADYVRVCFGNLVMRGHASWSGRAEDGVRFTKNGFVVGEIVNDLQRRRFAYSVYYYFFYGLSWAIFVAGAIIVIAEAWKVSLPFFSAVWSHFLHPIWNVISEGYFYTRNCLHRLFPKS